MSAFLLIRRRPATQAWQRSRVALAALGAALVPSVAVGYSQLIVFGDSLSDAGQFPDPQALVLGEIETLRFTNRLGPSYLPPSPHGEVSTQRLATALGVGPLYPSTSLVRDQLGLADGTDYATGGYTTAQVLASITREDGSVVDTGLISRTRDGYLVEFGAADPEALYYLNGGGNDFLDGLVTDPASATASGATLAAGAEALIAAGARTLMVANLPDVGKTPAGLASGQREPFSALSAVYNRALGTRLAAYDGKVDIVRLDVGALFDEVVAAPADFGLAEDVVQTDVCFSDPACDVTAYGLAAGNPDPSRLLFDDTVHPTTAGQQILADYARALVEAPQRLALAGGLGLGALEAQQQAIGDELRPGLQRQGIRFFAHGDDQRDWPDPYMADGEPQAAQQGAGIGVVVPLGAGWWGAAVARRDASLDAPNRIELDGTFYSLFARQSLGRLGVQAIVSAGDVDLDLRREVTLGKARRTLRGDSTGDGWSAEARLDYRLTAPDSAWYNAPFVAYRHSEMDIDGYRESGSRANALEVGEHHARARQAELGVMFDRSLAGGLGGFAELAWGRYLDDPREAPEVRLRSLPTNRWSADDVEREDDDYLRVEGGLRVRLGDALLHAGVGAQGWDDWRPSVQVGIGFTL